MNPWVLFFMSTTAVFAAQWFVAKTSFMAIIMWIKDKKLEPPSLEEFEERVRRATRQMLGLDRKQK